MGVVGSFIVFNESTVSKEGPAAAEHRTVGNVATHTG